MTTTAEAPPRQDPETIPLPPARRLGEWMLKRRWPTTLAFVTILVLAWQLQGILGRLPAYVLPPSEIVAAAVRYLADGTLGPATISSLQRLGMGFVVGTGLGVLVGLLAGVNRVAEDVADPVVSLTYPLPKIALFPVFAVWLGFNDRSRILTIALACFYPAFVNALSGTRGISRQLVWVAANLGASKVRTFFAVVLPAALPRVLVGVRISLALSFVLLFSTEAIASREGLGFYVFEGYLNVRYDLMYAAIAVLALLGFMADRLLLLVGGWLTRGQAIEAVGRG